MQTIFLAIQLRHELITLDGIPEQYAMHQHDFVALRFRYERGEIVVFIDPKASLSRIYQMIEEKSRKLYLGKRLAIEDAIFTPEAHLNQLYQS